MRLPANLFRDITGCESTGMAVLPHEKRRAARIPVGAKATAVVTGKDLAPATVQVQVREISVLGVGVLHPADVDLGAEFTLKVNKLSGDTVAIRCAAVRTCRVGKTLSATGASFTRLDDPSHLDPGALPAAAQSEADRVRRAILA